MKMMKIDNKSLIKYFKMKYIDICEKSNNKFLLEIQRKSIEYNIDAELIFGIITLEKMNRGDILTRVSEKILVYLYPSLLINKNASLGIGQVKITTAKEVLGELPDRAILKALINSDINLEVVSRLLLKYYNKVSKEENRVELIKKISNLYITGKVDPRSNFQIDMHSLLLVWSIKNSLFKEYQLKSQTKKCKSNDINI